MNELVLKGKTEVCGIEIPNIAGGFGKDKKAMLAKDIAKLHDFKPHKVNQDINRHRNKFKDGVDIIDLKKNNFAITLSESGIVTHNAVNAMKHFYLLSARGYAKLIKIFDDDLSWKRYDQILDEYFEFKEEIQKTGAYITNKANPEVLRVKADEIESLSVVNETLKIVMDRIDKIPVAEESKVLVMKGILKKAGVEIPIDVTAEQKYYDSMQIAKEVGIYSNSGKPHSQAVNAILAKIEILDNEKKDVWETNGSWQGTVTKYTMDVIRKVQK
ncbi:ORF6N domain-containing protein [Clostridium botulinum]|uniref:ORF6N domain-containing protein n=1 Tax=Clostridium botulinum TaxID=1491 RepID=UPI00096DB411|nr:ORF6N domain-containing protein [Clostridium botulinum]